MDVRVFVCRLLCFPPKRVLLSKIFVEGACLFVGVWIAHLDRGKLYPYDGLLVTTEEISIMNVTTFLCYDDAGVRDSGSERDSSETAGC